MFKTTSTRARATRAGIVGLTAVLAVALSACSTGTSTPTSTPTGAADNSNLATINAKVAALEKSGTYAIPTGSISNIKSVSGKTVYYIPITQQSPQFAVTQAALQAAFKPLGLNLQVCNGNATPTGIGACMSQATKAQAAAIITDAIPYDEAANAFQAAAAAGIPVLNTNQTADPQHPATSKLGYIYAAGSAQMTAVADWIISDSKGKATVVIDESTDGASTVQFVTDAQKEFKTFCPGCTIAINKISSSNFGLIAPSTSSALLKTPNVGYVVSEFDQYLQPILGGVQQAGKIATVKGVSGAAQLSGLQMLANKNFLYASVGQASAYQGWVDTDAVLRMITGTSGAKLPTYTIPIRLFTRDNIGDVTLTDSAQASGEWFGSSSYTSAFLKHWGVN
jgi:ribose transport system substrate-binding protein